MEFSQIRCFLAVAETLHFTRAAEQMHLSQPALSSQIRQIEDHLGVRLFERSHLKTTLTFAGTVFREEATNILEKAGRAAERARAAAEGRIGRVHIGFISTAAGHMIPTLVSRFQRSHPDIELKLTHGLTAAQIDLLRMRSIDVGFVRIPLSDPQRAGLCVVPVHREPFKLFLPADHELATRPHLAMRDLDGVDFVTYSQRNAPGFAATLTSMLQEASVRPTSMHEATDMYTLISLVSAGVGVAIAPASLENYRLPDVVIRDLPEARPSEIGLVHRDDLDHPAALAFVRMATTVLTGR